MGVGVVGIIECNFLKPTHNKQDFDYTNEYRCVAYLTFCLFIFYFGNAFITFSKDFFYPMDVFTLWDIKKRSR